MLEELVDERSSLAGGENGDREDFDGAGERDIEDNLSRTCYQDTDVASSQFKNMSGQHGSIGEHKQSSSNSIYRSWYGGKSDVDRAGVGVKTSAVQRETLSSMST